MPIKSNIPVPVIAVGTTDTALLQPASPITRAAVQACVLHNTSSSANITVTIYESPDLTSASGDEIAEYILGPKEAADVWEVIGQAYGSGAPGNLIAVADVAGVNARLTVTQYDGAS